ncbi:MAG: large-conductance mechanosensitive channel protein MscL [Epulopiscium sp.]|nr:large-conductance mechanosensitive channel protein MscL [Candidatus Epulonipiscium sp.]
MFKDFKEFAMQGNVLDLATGVVIGGAFGSIVSSLVDDIIMPLMGLLLGGRSFESRTLLLREAVGDQPDLLLHYGAFIQSVVDFLIISFSIFLFIKLITSFRSKSVKEEVEKEDPSPSSEEVLLTEIRDLLKK